MTGTERKTFQKYYPPDFDPSKIPRAKQPRNRQFVQRIMAPFNMQCNTCGEYIYKGKKFNMRREMAEGEDYLGLRIFRFYFRCPNCLAEITFKTDLENCDYANEHGATRLFEATKLLQEQEKQLEKQEAEDRSNPMKMLEKRTKMSRAEMEALGKLEELQELNRRQAKVNYEGMLGQYQQYEAEQLRKQEEADEQFVQSIFGRSNVVKVEDEGGGDAQPSSSGGGVKVKRLIENSDDEDDLAGPSITKDEAKDFSANPIFGTAHMAKKPKMTSVSSQKKLLSGMVIIKKNTELSSDMAKRSETGVKQPEKGANPAGGLSLLGDYGGGSSSGADSE